MNFQNEFYTMQPNFSKFYQKKLFADVTLVADDLVSFDAHRVVLSAHSPILEGLLSISDQETPTNVLLYLRGISGSMLQKVLSYFYYQEVHVEESCISNFVSLMNDDLQVSGFQIKEANNEEIKKNRKISKTIDGKAASIGVPINSIETIMNKQNRINVDNPPNKETFYDNKDTFDDKTILSQIQSDLNSDENSLKYSIDDCESENEGNLVKNSDFIEEIDPQRKPNYECGMCDLQFDYKLKLGRHYRKYHKGEDFKCKTCSTSFQKHTQLSVHFLSLHLPPRYKCLFCDFQSGTLTYAASHARKHKPATIVCNLCEKLFRSMGDLNIHKRLFHETEKSECSYCKVKLKKHNLKGHIEAKHKLIKYNCSFCPFQATSKNYLKQHENARHLGQTFECNYCDYQAKMKLSLTNHHKIVHENLRFYCDECPMKFRSPNQMKKHKIKKH